MEDGVISEDEKLTRTHDHDEGKEQGGGGGLINHVLSSLVPKGQGEEDHKVGEYGREVKEGEHEVEEKKQPSSSTTGGGILDQLLKSTLVSPRASTNGNRGDIFRESDEVGEVGKGKEEEEEASSDEGNGIIGNIVSHLSNLPDNAAPTTDEASILIHSIVRD